MASSAQSTEVQNAVARVKLMLNRQLIYVLKAEGLAHTGVKLAMQQRIIQQLEHHVATGNVTRLDRLRHFIKYPEPTSNMPSPGHKKLGGHGQNSPAPSAGPNGHARAYNPASNLPAASFESIAGPLHFKDSPYFTILQPLSTVKCLPSKSDIDDLHQRMNGSTYGTQVMNQNRHSVDTPIRLTRPVVDRLKADRSTRIMVYCGADSGLGSYTRADIAFPHNIELKVNQDDVKANLRGLKNKPGSTRPADITTYMRKLEGYLNTLTLTYALTSKKYGFVVNLVKVHSVDELVDRLRVGKFISKESVIREMEVRAQDPDIVATSTVMSLKCPLSTLRMDLPCRSTVCSHNQCFDGASFLQLQEQAPTWTCPICNKIISFEALAVDRYVKEILDTTSKSVEQVTIEPNGHWSLNALPPSPPRSAAKRGLNDDDDDLVEISGMRGSASKGTPMSRLNGQNTPGSSREASTIDTVARSTSNKRPAAQVIDLTLSSDEDSDPRPPKKRPSQGTPSLPLPPPPPPPLRLSAPITLGGGQNLNRMPPGALYHTGQGPMRYHPGQQSPRYPM